MTGGETILVTGGAGYVGSHAALAIHRRGFPVVILDDLSRGHRDTVEEALGLPLVVGDVSDRAVLDRLFSDHDIVAVMHFAALAEVAESVVEPARYYRANLAGTLTLLEAMAEAGVECLVFSSTAAVYGEPEAELLTEALPRRPINPYGRSKAMAEEVIEDLARAGGLRAVVFRYFNAAGADSEGRIGERHHPETHLIPLVLQVALGRREKISIYGTDYPTPDGTCLRDYVHVDDLAEAHILGLHHLLEGGGSLVLNLGSGLGFSVREVIEAAWRVTGREIQAEEAARRPGDPLRLVADVTMAHEILGWSPRHGLEATISHAWVWHGTEYAP